MLGINILHCRSKNRLDILIKIDLQSTIDLNPKLKMIKILVLIYLIFPKLVENFFRFIREFIIYFMCANLITVLIIGIYSYLYDIISILFNKIE